MTNARYSVGTWDTYKQRYTPQRGMSVPAFGLTIQQLRQAVRDLRNLGYSVHRRRDSDGTHEDNDWTVIIERTDEKSWKEVMRGWIR